jgi:hypothetical protein
MLNVDMLNIEMLSVVAPYFDSGVNNAEKVLWHCHQNASDDDKKVI